MPLDAHEIGRRGVCVVGALGIAFAKPAEQQRADAMAALDAASAGLLVPRIGGTFPLEGAAAAHTALQGRRTVGALLITP